jgi:Tfp pilus assembly protein PilF
MRRMALLLTAITCAASLTAAPRLQLRGKVTGAINGRFRLILYGVDSPYEHEELILPGQEFRFHPLESGSYTLVVIRRGIGQIRRTVVVTPSFADKKGIVRFNVAYVPSEAALEGRGALVSSRQLSIPGKALRKLAEARERLTRRQKARAVVSLKQAVEVAPRFSAAWNMLGVISYQDRDFSNAEEYFQRAVDTDPQSFEAIVNLGGAQLSTGKLVEALANNQRAQTARPQDPLANAQLGLSYFQLGDNDHAEPYLVKAKRIDPAHFTRPQLYLAQIYLARGDVNLATSELRDFIRRYPDAPEAESLREKLNELDGKAR